MICKASAILSSQRDSTYTLGKGCYTPIWGNKIDLDFFVLPMGGYWHEVYLWLLPNEIWPYLGQTFTLMPSVIVEVQTVA